MNEKQKPLLQPPMSADVQAKIIEEAMSRFIRDVTEQLEKRPDSIVQVVDALLRYAVLFTLSIVKVRDEPKTEQARVNLIGTTAKKLLRNLFDHVKAK
jgi:hypothetical protein